MECPIINPALSLLMKHIVLGQRQKAPNFSAFHWSPHAPLVSIGQQFVTMRVVHVPKTTETSLITESDRSGPGGGRVVRWSWVNFQCRGVLLVWIRVGQGPTALAIGAGGGRLDIFALVYPFSALSPSLWETTRYRLKYCLKGSLSPKTTNQPTEADLITESDQAVHRCNSWFMCFFQIL